MLLRSREVLAPLFGLSVAWCGCCAVTMSALRAKAPGRPSGCSRLDAEGMIGQPTATQWPKVVRELPAVARVKATQSRTQANLFIKPDAAAEE